MEKCERELVPFPIDIDTDIEPEEIITQALETVERLAESTERCISELPEKTKSELHEYINISIPNRTSHIEKYLRQLMVFMFEYKVQIDPNSKKNRIKLEKYKNELKKFIEETSLID